MAILVLTHPLPNDPFVSALKAAAPHVPVWTEDDLPDPNAVEVIVAWRMRAGFLPRFPNLRVLCCPFAGVDKLLGLPDLPAHVPITRIVDPMQAVEIAQYVVANALHHTRDLDRYAEQQTAAHWARHPVRKPAQCRVGILGLGEVGQAVARAFLPLGYPVAGWSRSGRDVPGVTSHRGASALPQLLAQSDILVCTLPLTPETRGLLNRDMLAQLPPGAFLINVGRGEHLVEADLKALLDSGALSGAALDVFEREPPQADNWVWHHPKVVATPHIAAQASYELVATQCLDALQRARDGLDQPFAIDPARGY